MHITSQTRIKTVVKSLDGAPAFLIEYDNKQYISHGCQFIENTESNRAMLIADYNCEAEINELLEQPWQTIPDLTNTGYMFVGCDDLISFKSDLPLVTKSGYMFTWCRNLNQLVTNLPNIQKPDQRSMFVGCYKLSDQVKRAISMKYLRSKTESQNNV